MIPGPESVGESDRAILPQTPRFRLDGKTALITGASRGLGVGCAAALAQAGASVTLAARTAEELHLVAEAIKREGGAADWIAVDVTDERAISSALTERPPFDILVNNAGSNRPARFVDVSPEDFDAVMALNLRAAFFVSQAVARKLIDAGRTGSIINMSSQMGHVGAASRTVYCASKHALEGLTKAMAVDLGPMGIRVNSIAPTFIETSLTKSFLEDPNFRAEALAKSKMGRLGVLEDIMGAVVFLASDASALMTGSSMVVDGGWTAD